MAQFKVAVVVGSTRRESINRNSEIADLPLYNQDNEGNLPASVVRFKAELAAADGVLFVTPEHSRSIPAALKNAIDWGARPWGKNSWAGKVAAVTGASPGAISTALAQQHLRQILGAQGVVLAGGEAYLQFKTDLIDANHGVTDEGTRGFLKSFLDQFAVLVGKLAAPVKA
ncbi:MAG: NAD(P)H-dependent oxidoreductase [Alphaproteobacteria bacterium]|nr:NAD(P)H-dependent oxidoreductase [Alphaproteobacteria bacterium]